jgi:hypothetical protein
LIEYLLCVLLTAGQQAPGASTAGAEIVQQADSSGAVDSLLFDLDPSDRGPRIMTPEERSLRQAGEATPGKHQALLVGEKLTFSVRYGIVRAGEASLEIAAIEDVAGRPCYHVVSRARSNTFFDTVYRVRDQVDSWFDVDYLFSRRFRKSLQEGGYRAKQEIEMDQESRLARYQDGRVCEFVYGSQDVLSAFYYVRTLDLKLNQKLALDSHADHKNFPLAVTVRGRERIDTPAGKFDCLVVEPFLRTPGLFKQEGTLTIWLTDDERRMPVQMKSKIAVGSISVVLTDYMRPGNR